MTLKEILILSSVGLLAVGFITMDVKYENDTLKSAENINKIDCKKVYDARFCKPEYITVPPYKKHNVETKKTPGKFSLFKKKSSKETLWKENKDIIIGMIKEHEEFRAKGYPDGCLEKVKVGHKCPVNKVRYSIGYGTIELS